MHCHRKSPEITGNLSPEICHRKSKYLKSRKGRTLSLDEINHISDVAGTLAFTVSQMKLIDAAYLAAFPERG